MLGKYCLKRLEDSSLEAFMCLDLVSECWQSFLIQNCFNFLCFVVVFYVFYVVVLLLLFFVFNLSHISKLCVQELLWLAASSR